MWKRYAHHLNGRCRCFYVITISNSFSCYFRKIFPMPFVPTQSSLIHGLGHANFSGVYISPLIFRCVVFSKIKWISGVRNKSALKMFYFHCFASNSVTALITTVKWSNTFMLLEDLLSEVNVANCCNQTNERTTNISLLENLYNYKVQQQTAVNSFHTTKREWAKNKASNNLNVSLNLI